MCWKNVASSVKNVTTYNIVNMERRLKMKLNKKTIYHVKTKELYDKMMNDAEEQGYYWVNPGDAKTHNTDKWTVYRNETCVKIDSHGVMWYGDVDYYSTDYKNYARVEYKDTPEVYSIFGGLCVDAPDFSTAYDAIKDYIQHRGAIPIRNNVYTIRVEDDTTTVITPEGKMATAKCHPDDDFDVVEGFRVALEKIKESERKLTQREKDILNAIIVLGGHSLCVTDDHDLIVDFDDENIYVDIKKDDFKWLNIYEDYDPKELLEKYA
jgi:hypothetical protein